MRLGSTPWFTYTKVQDEIAGAHGKVSAFSICDDRLSLGSRRGFFSPWYNAAMQDSPSGAVLLSHLTHAVIDVYCTRCGRPGRYRHSTLLERFGPDAGLPDVASTLEDGCERKGQHGGCFVIFPALAQQ